MQIVNHLLADAQYYPSPHQEDLPGEMSLIVIHSMSLPYGEYANDYIKQLFLGNIDCNAHPSFADLQGLRVSAHIVIKRDGTIMQFVPFNKKAWHAGESSYQGRNNCNDFSIGIEMEGSAEDSYTDKQYNALQGVCKALLGAYKGITPISIVGHKDIASGRKTDPWCFDWSRLEGIA